jgi:uncharacterized protein (TIGR02246 family)
MLNAVRLPRWSSPFLLAGVLATGCAPAEPAAPNVDLAAEEAAIRTRSEAIAAAEQAKNGPAMAAFYAEDVVVHPSGSPRLSGRAAYQEYFTGLMSQLPPDASLVSTTGGITVASSGDMAVETGSSQFTMGGTTTAGKYLVVWRKISGEWLVAALSWNDDTAPAPAG